MLRAACPTFTALVFTLICTTAAAQTQVQTSGTQVVVPGMGEVTHPNDEVRVTFTADEQDKEKSVAASRVNQKMKQAIDLLRAADKTAVLRSRDYSTYPVYEEVRAPNVRPRVTGWRVTQSLDMTTSSFDGLPKAVAAAQKILGLNGMQYGLSRATAKRLDQQRIEAAYRDLSERIGFVAKAMGRSPADAVLELVDYEASGAYAQNTEVMMKGARNVMMAAAPYLPPGGDVFEPSFEPGETTLNMRVVAKVRFR